MEKKKYRIELVLVLLVGFLGGSVSQVFFSPKNLEAYDLKTLKALLAYQMQLIDKKGKVGVDVRNPQGEGFVHTMYDKNSNKIIQFGANDPTKKVSKGNKPFFSMFDSKENVRLKFWLKGHQEVPMITLFDQLENPRFEMGLNAKEVDELPFVKYYDIFGVGHQVFGQKTYK